MKSKPKPVYGNIAAAMLAGLTLLVFYRLQYAGPESAIVRFNDMILQAPDYSFHGEARLRGQNLEIGFQRFVQAMGVSGIMELQQVSTGVVPPKDVRQPSDEVIRMLMHLKDWYDAGATIQVGWMDRTPDRVRADVVYHFPAPDPNGMETHMDMVWVVVRRGKSWYVDANQTAVILADNDPS